VPDRREILQTHAESAINATVARMFASAAVVVVIAMAVSLTPAAAGAGGGGHGGGGSGAGNSSYPHRFAPPSPGKVSGTSKPINCKAGGAGCLKQK